MRSPPGRLASVFDRGIWNNRPPSAASWSSAASRASKSLARRRIKKWATTAVMRKRRSQSGAEKASWANRQTTDAGRATRFGFEPCWSSHALVNPSYASATMFVAHGLGKPAARWRFRMGDRYMRALDGCTVPRSQMQAMYGPTVEGEAGRAR